MFDCSTLGRVLLALNVWRLGCCSASYGAGDRYAASVLSEEQAQRVSSWLLPCPARLPGSTCLLDCSSLCAPDSRSALSISSRSCKGQALLLSLLPPLPSKQAKLEWPLHLLWPSRGLAPGQACLMPSFTQNNFFCIPWCVSRTFGHCTNQSCLPSALGGL